jgi:hypothetical protein
VEAAYLESFIVNLTMENERELTEAIVKMTMTIHESYPELSKYLGEMPVDLSYQAGEEIHVKNLKNYLETLKTLINKYKLSHTTNK